MSSPILSILALAALVFLAPIALACAEDPAGRTPTPQGPAGQRNAPSVADSEPPGDTADSAPAPEATNATAAEPPGDIAGSAIAPEATNVSPGRLESKPEARTSSLPRRLPAPGMKGSMSLEEALASRRSVRSYRAEPLTEEHLSQLLWAAQGITHGDGHRTAPSAGALYPLELYVATKNGLHRYEPQGHALRTVLESDLRPAICRAALDQGAVCHAPAVFIITAVHRRTAVKYGKTRAWRYLDMEAGHAAQNILLQAVALGLGAVPMGAFHDDRLARLLDLPEEEVPRYLIPVGRLARPR